MSKIFHPLVEWKNVLLMMQNIKYPIKNIMHESPITNFVYKAVHNDES